MRIGIHHKICRIRTQTNLNYQKMVSREYALKVLQAAKGCPLKASVLWLKGPAATPKVMDYTSKRYKRFVAEWEAFTGISITQDPLIARYCQ